MPSPASTTTSVTTSSDNAPSIETLAPQTLAPSVPVTPSVLGNIVPGTEFPFQYQVRSVVGSGRTLVAHTPSTQDKIAARSLLFQQAEFTQLEAVIIPRQGLFDHSATIWLGWVPSGTSPSSNANLASYAGAVVRTYGGPALIGQETVVPAPLASGLQGIFRGNVTLSYQPTLYYAVSAIHPAPSSSTAPENSLETFTILVRGRIKMSGQMLVSWE